MRNLLLLMTVLACRTTVGDDQHRFREIKLRPPEWRLFVPEEFVPDDDRADLLVHFHGHPPTVLRNATEARLDAFVVTVNYPGLSSVYRRPFSNPELFGVLLDESRAAIGADARLASVRDFGRIAVSSFSAGYGAVRELLRQPYQQRIAGVLAADSLYASTASDGTPDDEQMAPYVAYAQRAARGEVAFVLTHTEVETPTYESTRETADELLERLGMTATQIDRAGRGPLRLTRHARYGRFEVWGSPGATGEDHMAHLRHMSEWLGSLPLNKTAPDASR